VTDVDDLLARLDRGWLRSMPAARPLPDRSCRTAARNLGCDGGAITMLAPLVEHALPIAFGKDALPLLPFVESSARTPA
jgi:hypothetical protein